jgi:hypothetical protein
VRVTCIVALAYAIGAIEDRADKGNLMYQSELISFKDQKSRTQAMEFTMAGSVGTPKVRPAAPPLLRCSPFPTPVPLPHSCARAQGSPCDLPGGCPSVAQGHPVVGAVRIPAQRVWRSHCRSDVHTGAGGDCAGLPQLRAGAHPPHSLRCVPRWSERNLSARREWTWVGKGPLPSTHPRCDQSLPYSFE